MNIYLLYKTEDMKNMKPLDVREARNKLEGAIKDIPSYDLAVIDSVLWRVAVVDNGESTSTINTGCKRFDIPSNSQGFRGTALGVEGNTISREFVYNIKDKSCR